MWFLLLIRAWCSTFFFYCSFIVSYLVLWIHQLRDIQQQVTDYYFWLTDTQTPDREKERECNEFDNDILLINSFHFCVTSIFSLWFDGFFSFVIINFYIFTTLFLIIWLVPRQTWWNGKGCYQKYIDAHGEIFRIFYWKFYYDQKKRRNELFMENDKKLTNSVKKVRLTRQKYTRTRASLNLTSNSRKQQ